MTHVEIKGRRRTALVVTCALVYGVSVLCSVLAAVVMLPGAVRRGQPLNGWLRPTAQQAHTAAVRDSRELALALRR